MGDSYGTVKVAAVQAASAALPDASYEPLPAPPARPMAPDKDAAE